MKIRYFAETDTLHIEFSTDAVRETRELDEDTLADVDEAGRLCALTIEHASARTGVPQFSYEQVGVE
jgi:uncharacterized protein YuzE